MTLRSAAGRARSSGLFANAEARYLDRMYSKSFHLVVHDPELAAREVRSYFAGGVETGEIWIERGEARVCAMLCADRGWMMWLRSESDPGLFTRNPDHDGPEDAALEFTLVNGQVDRYPTSWTLPREQIAAALECYAREGDMPRGLVWDETPELARVG